MRTGERKKHNGGHKTEQSICTRVPYLRVIADMDWGRRIVVCWERRVENRKRGSKGDGVKEAKNEGAVAEIDVESERRENEKAVTENWRGNAGS